jgi:hypothetical protein
MEDVTRGMKTPFRCLWGFHFIALLTSPLPLYLGGLLSVFLWMLPAIFVNWFWRKGVIKLYSLLVFLFWLMVVVFSSFISNTFIYFNPLR